MNSSDLTDFVKKEAAHLLCDDELGRGMSRTVYGSKLLPDHVVKVESSAGFFQNVIEWETWQRVKGTPAERWFAPCAWISEAGGILIMARTSPFEARRAPKEMPAFLCDFKYANYGLYKGHVVCHDYGTSFVFEHGFSTKRMRKPSWYDSSKK